jgi:hypothetical protein
MNPLRQFHKTGLDEMFIESQGFQYSVVTMVLVVGDFQRSYKISIEEEKVHSPS